MSDRDLSIMAAPGDWMRRFHLEQAGVRGVIGRDASLESMVPADAVLVWRWKDLATYDAQRSEPLHQALPDAVQRLLIVGDSTGVGTGASSPRSSLAGLIAAAAPVA